MKDIIFRKVESADAEQFVKLNNFVWRVAYKDIFPEEVFEERDNFASQKIQDFEKIYYNDDTEIVYVAEHDGKIVGLLLGKTESDYNHFKEGAYADLQALYVHPDYQGQGIASKLKEIFVEWARKNGAIKFVIGVLKDNGKARNVYEKWGGRLDKHSQPFEKLGKKYDEVFYTYEIPEKEQ